VRDIISDWRLDFCGIKGQPELTDHFCTMDIAEAFCNAPYDWEGPHDPIVCATEADMDGALTMELFKHVAGTPVLFADVRHYDAADNVWDLCNSGQHATYFAGRSFDPKVNLPKVRFYPEIIYFPAGGASVAHIAAPGPVTLARLARRQVRYWMAIGPAVLVDVASGRVAATASVPFPYGVIDRSLPGQSDHLPPDWALQHPGDWVAAAEQLLRTMAQHTNPDDIVGLGVDCTSCTVLPVTAEGTPLCLQADFARDPHAWPKLWKHHAAQPYADRINAARARAGGAFL